jgi:hypothetical protein
MNLPLQAEPVERNLLLSTETQTLDATGMQASQASCANLPGLARQMCYATMQGVAI